MIDKIGSMILCKDIKVNIDNFDELLSESF